MSCAATNAFNLFSHLAIILEGLFSAGSATYHGKQTHTHTRALLITKKCDVCYVGAPVQFSNANYCNLLFTNAHILNVCSLDSTIISLGRFTEEVAIESSHGIFIPLPPASMHIRIYTYIHTHNHTHIYTATDIRF